MAISPSVASATQDGSLRNAAFKVLRQIAIYIAVVLAITWFCRFALLMVFEVPMQHQYWLRDFMANLLLAVLVAALVKTFNKALLLSSLIIVMLQMCNGAKLSILGTPASPDDVLNIQNFFYLTDGWRRWLLFAIAGLPFALAISFFAYKRPRFWLTTSLLVFLGWSVNANSDTLRVYLDTQFGNSVWNQPANFRKRGLGLHLAQESIRTLSKVDAPPSKPIVEETLRTLSQVSNATSQLELQLSNASKPMLKAATPLRNVHVFVLESFFDPMALGSDWVPEDPLPESFRRLWGETGNSMALSPVFGGYTANAEFEVLCGFPVTRNAVFFEGWLRRRAPCLPQVLSQMGYDTIASHPNVPGFWNRTHAYELIGFDQYLSKKDFDLTDSVDTLLMDHSLYQQVFDKLDQQEPSQAVLNYMLTYHGHLPYPSNDNYPDQIQAGKESTLLHGYLNQIWYKSRALMDRLDTLRQEDPDSLIVIFGDHLPYLGPNYGVYTEAWQLPEKREDYNGEQLENLVSTPLIVIDGKNGPLPLGKLPLYRLPSLIVSLLDHGNEPLAFDWSRNPNGSWIRPVYGMHINVTQDSSFACTEANASTQECATSQVWFEHIKLLIGDIFTGKQHSLSELSAASSHTPQP